MIIYICILLLVCIKYSTTYNSCSTSTTGEFGRLQFLKVSITIKHKIEYKKIRACDSMAEVESIFVAPSSIRLPWFGTRCQ